MTPAVPTYIYGRECGENEKVVPLETVIRLINQAYSEGFEEGRGREIDPDEIRCRAGGIVY